MGKREQDYMRKTESKGRELERAAYQIVVEHKLRVVALVVGIEREPCPAPLQVLSVSLPEIVVCSSNECARLRKDGKVVHREHDVGKRQDEFSSKQKSGLAALHDRHGLAEAVSGSLWFPLRPKDSKVKVVPV